MRKLNKSLTLLLPLGLAVLALLAQSALAQSSSSSYQINESYFGPGGLLESYSTSYQLGSQAGGDTAVGEGASGSFRTQPGFNTSDEPRLVVLVATPTINFGALSTTVATTATAQFAVLNYTSYGYVVHTVGAPPTNGSHTLSAMSSTGPSVVGTEQFGINLRANTSPMAFGADPVQVPDSSFSFGEAATNYNTANSYRYVMGETIARSVKTSGETDYTIAYIINVATTTPGGRYQSSQELVVTGTY